MSKTKPNNLHTDSGIYRYEYCLLNEDQPWSIANPKTWKVWAPGGAYAGNFATELDARHWIKADGKMPLPSQLS
jgi:hypothetical protein